MSVKLNATSLKRLEGVHPHLITVIMRAAEISDLQFQVTEGVRSLARQRELVKAGASQTLRSRHLKAPNGLSHAIDVVVLIKGRSSWEFSLYAQLSETLKRAAREVGIEIEWGGDWKSIKDGPHYQLPWDQYPGVVAKNDKPVPRPTADELATLVVGASGEAVLELQRQLNASGAAIAVDGDFGPRTLAAVKTFQAAGGLKADGIVGPKTRAALAKAAGSKAA